MYNDIEVATKHPRPTDDDKMCPSVHIDSLTHNLDVPKPVYCSSESDEDYTIRFIQNSSLSDDASDREDMLIESDDDIDKVDIFGSGVDPEISTWIVIQSHTVKLLQYKLIHSWMYVYGHSEVFQLIGTNVNTFSRENKRHDNMQNLMMMVHKEKSGGR